MNIDCEIIPGTGLIVHYDDKQIDFNQFVDLLRKKIISASCFQHSSVGMPEIHKNTCKILITLPPGHIFKDYSQQYDQIFKAITDCLLGAEKH